MDAFNPPHSLHLMPSTMPPGTPIADTATPAPPLPGNQTFRDDYDDHFCCTRQARHGNGDGHGHGSRIMQRHDSGTGSDSDTDASPDIPSTHTRLGAFGLSIHSQSSQMAQPASQLARGGHGHDSALHTSTGTPTQVRLPERRRRQRIQCFEAGDYSHLGVKSAAASTPPAQPGHHRPRHRPVARQASTYQYGKRASAATMSLTAQDWTGIPEFPLDCTCATRFGPAPHQSTPARSSTPRDTAMADTPPLLAVPMASFSAATASGIAPPSRTPAEWTTSGFFASSSSTPRKLRVIPPKAPATGSIRRRDTMRPALQRQDTLELPDILAGRGGQMGTKMASSESDGSFSSTSTVELDAHSPPHQSLLSGFESLSDAEDPPAVYRGPTDPLPKSCLKRAAKRARDDSEADDHDVGDALGTGIRAVKEFDWTDQCFKLGEERMGQRESITDEE
ncbi:hypothetical protein BCR44DRAFT_1440090 [Catenaria anguillulae PL171]|uniref:Uncharacterized protein n=1 Tax=Catenaria anguillulae PL171 TaxID=765915 RepID=A0A1Y2HHJ7_9FUNG|nr:hypothetical protein BCR44DRAFT_1440090 [Catenaria anguillulae PL171]